MIQFHSNEKRDLSRINYARAGSYFYLNEDYFKRILRLTPFKSGDMTMYSDMSFWVQLLQDGKPIRYHYYGDPGSLKIINVDVYAEIALTDASQVRFRGTTGVGLRLDLDSNMEGATAAALDSFAYLKDGTVEGVFGKHGYLRFEALKGKLDIDSVYDYEKGQYTRFNVSFLPDEDGCFEAVMIDSDAAIVKPETYKPFDEVTKETIQSYLDFYKNYKGLPQGKEYKTLLEDVIYVTWSHVVKQGGMVKSPMILFHYNAIAAAMSWQQSYNGMAFLGNPEEGFRLIANMFLYQSESNGSLPGSVTPSTVGEGGVQAPLQGFALTLLCRQCGEDFITREMASDLLPKMAKWVNYWTTYRVSGFGEDVIAINNPNESGWDDSSNWKNRFPCSNADNLALLTECMYACEILARRAGKPDDEAYWKKRADRLLGIIVNDYWNGERFVSKTKDGVVDSQSLACYIPILLGDRLPQNIIDKCAEVLTEEGNFLSDMGLCSESMRSELCHWGWHFVLGRVVAPQQMYTSVGLYLAGKKKEAKLIASRWCETVKELGPRLGFKPYTEYPLTGKPADFLVEPECGDGWSWCAWSACPTMTMLQIVLGDE